MGLHSYDDVVRRFGRASRQAAPPGPGAASDAKRWDAGMWCAAALGFVVLSLAGLVVPHVWGGLPGQWFMTPPWGIALTIAVLARRPCADRRYWLQALGLFGALHVLTVLLVEWISGVPLWRADLHAGWLALHLLAAALCALLWRQISFRYGPAWFNYHHLAIGGLVGVGLLWLTYAGAVLLVGWVLLPEWTAGHGARVLTRCLIIGLFFVPFAMLWVAEPRVAQKPLRRDWGLAALHASGFSLLICLAGIALGGRGSELPLLIWFGAVAFAPVRVALLMPLTLMAWASLITLLCGVQFMPLNWADPDRALSQAVVWLLAYLAAGHLRSRWADLVRDSANSRRLLHAVMARNPVGILIRPVDPTERMQMNSAFQAGLVDATAQAGDTPASLDLRSNSAGAWIYQRLNVCELGFVEDGAFHPLPAASLLEPSMTRQVELDIEQGYLRLPDGSVRFLKLKTALVHDEQGVITHGVLYAEDRTDISVRSQLLQAVVDALPVGVMLQELAPDAATTRVSTLVNPAHVGLYGLTPEQARGTLALPVGLKVVDAAGALVFGGPSLRRLADFDQEAIAALFKPCAVLITRSAGEVRHGLVMVRELRLASMRSSYQLLLTIDTHEIETQRQLLDAVVERLPIGFSILPAQAAEPVRINVRQLDNLGLTRAEYDLGPDHWSGMEMGVWSADGRLTPLPFRSPLRESMETARELDEPHAYIRRPDGSMRYVHMSTRLLKDEGGEVTHVLGFASDRTELVTQQLLLGHIVRHAPVGIVVRRARDGHVALMNEAIDRVLGWAKDAAADLATDPIQPAPGYEVGYEVQEQLVPDTSADPMAWPVDLAGSDGKTPGVRQHVYVRHPDGQLRFGRLNRVPVSDIAGQPIYSIAYVVDETLLRRQTRLLRRLVETMPIGVCVMEIDGGNSPSPIYVNRAMADMLGHAAGQVDVAASVATGFAASFDDGEVFSSGDGHIRGSTYVARLLQRGFVEHARLLAITRRDGSARVADLWARPIYAPGGEIEYVVLVASDQTEQHTLRIMADAANSRLLVANERLSEIVNHMPCGLLAFDGQGLMLAANQLVKDMLEMPGTLFAQQKVWFDDLTRFQALRGEYGDGDVEGIVTSRRDILHLTHPRHYERQRVNGRVYEVSSAPLARGGIVTTYTDVTERKANEAQIRQLAFYDPLTGLPNRRLLLDRVGQALQSAARNGWIGAVLFLDLDQFKNLNDTRGHDAGDALLKLMGERLVSAVRSVDTVSRMGGDEFVILTERLGATDTEAMHAARRIAAKVHHALMEPYLLGSDAYNCTCSIGIALLGEGTESVEAILKQADIALYQAKDAGRNAIRFFDQAMQAAVVGRAELEAGLRLALARQEFVLYYQPQIDRHGRVFGAETLLRWVRPAAPAVSPGVFIGVAEACGAIVPIGLWVFEQVCGQVAAWARMPHMAGLRVSVNLSARQLQESDIVEAFAARLRSSGANPGRIAIELTESLFIGEHGDALHKLHALKALGLHLSMDDFGTGYSSLSQLHRLPLDEIKIDQAFVRDIESDPGDAAVVRAVIAMGLALGLDVVAEGVETEGQRRYLAEQGATGYQGYLFGHPMAIQDIEHWLEQPPVFWTGVLS